jgi:hypothetical protein
VEGAGGLLRSERERPKAKAKEKMTKRYAYEKKIQRYK